MSSSISRARAPAVGPRAGLPVFPHSGALRGWGRHPGRQGPSCAKDRYSTHRQARCRGRGRPPRSTAPGTRVPSPAGAALRDAAAEAGRTPAPGQSLTSPSRGRRALGGWQRKEDRGPARRRNAPPHPRLREATTDGRAHPTEVTAPSLCYCRAGVETEFKFLWNFKGQ